MTGARIFVFYHSKIKFPNALETEIQGLLFQMKPSKHIIRFFISDRRRAQHIYVAVVKVCGVGIRHYQNVKGRMHRVWNSVRLSPRDSGNFLSRFELRASSVWQSHYMV